MRATTTLRPVALVPELRLHQADEVIDLWERTEAAVGGAPLAPPFWAFAWAGGQALARHLLDHAELVRGRRVLDVASGSGLVAVAAARAGAAAVTAAEVDPLAVAAVGCNAAANGVAVDARLDDVLDGDGGRAEVVLAGDVFYEAAMAARVLGLLQRVAVRGGTALVGDPGRSYLPRASLVALAAYDVPVARALEDADVKRTTVWRLAGGDGGPGGGRAPVAVPG